MFAFAVGMYGIGTSWVFNSFQSTGEISVSVSFWVTALFVLGNACVFTGVMVIVQVFWDRRPIFIENEDRRFTLAWNPSAEHRRYSAFGTVLAWIVFELLNTLVEWDMAFPWLLLGYAYIDTWLVGLATVGGVTLVSFFVLVTALALFRIQHIKPITMAITLLPWILGVGFLNVSWTQPGDEKKLALVQSNLSIAEKLAEDGLTTSWLENVRMSIDVKGVDFVIWPEGTLHATLDQRLVYSLYTLAARVDAPIITGTSGRSVFGDNEDLFYNVAVGVSQYEPEHQEYRKIKMVPFGESIPFEPLFRPVIDWLKLPITNISPGSGPQKNMVLDEVNVGITICYEIAFPSYVATRSRDADFLVTLSEDGWFGNSIGPVQHMQIARMRAVETGRYLARATTRGISGIVDPRGKIIATIPVNEPGVALGSIRTMQGKTWFVRYLSGLSGWILGAVAVLGSGALSILGSAVILMFMKNFFVRERRKAVENENPVIKADEVLNED